MGKVEQSNNNIMTERQFNSSPLRKLMSYNDYFKNALRLGSAFTFKHLFALKEAEETSEKIRESVKGWALEKEQNKDKAEKEYYAALAQYNSMKNASEEAYKNLLYTTNIYGEDSTRFSDALKKYNLSNKTAFYADIDLSCARDKFNFANTSAFKAFLVSRG